VVEEILAALRAARSRPATATVVTGIGGAGRVRLTLAPTGLHGCTVDPGWAARADDDALNAAVVDALAAARAELARQWTGGSDPGRLPAVPVVALDEGRSEVLAAEITTALRDFSDQLDEIGPAATAAADHWYVPPAVAGAIVWLANKTIEIGAELVDTCYALLNGPAVPGRSGAVGTLHATLAAVLVRLNWATTTAVTAFGSTVFSWAEAAVLAAEAEAAGTALGAAMAASTASPAGEGPRDTPLSRASTA
ncbi:MAG TPA: hypothetical protein VGD43_22040, partial [Micromonospora sp.]